VSIDADWIDLPGLDFKINGNDGSSIHFVSESVLARRVVLTGVVSFSALLTVCAPNSATTHSFRFADYAGLRPFRDGLSSIRGGSSRIASMSCGGFSMTVGLHKRGVREDLLVSGHFTSIQGWGASPWPPRIADLVLVNSESAACVQFAFLSSVVDPPYVDDAIAQIDHIIRLLQDQGFQP